MAITEEEQPLLPDHSRVTDRSEGWIASALQFRNWKANPYWYMLIPVILSVNMARGITMAPRIQVFREIACRSLHRATPNSLAPSGADLQMLMDCSGSDAAAKAAKIQAAVVTTMSVLSAVTTGFWSRLGDAYGRKPIFIMFLTGAIFMEFVFVLVMRPNTVFGRYAEHLILLGPIVEGFVGALATLNGVVHAYISDCTRHGSRSKIFSTIQGIVFIGLAAGPWLTGMIIPSDAPTDIFFYISMTTMTLTMIYMLVLCPESRERAAPVHSSHLANNDHTKTKTPMFVALRSYLLKFLEALVSPIAMFAPRPLRGNPRKTSYSLTLVGLAFFIYIISNGVYTSKYIFAQHLYSWTTIQLGYYMSLLWIMRAVNLLVVLPIVISYLKPKTSAAPGAPLSPRDVAAELRFDRHLAQASILLDGTSDLLVALTSQNSQIVFIILSCLTSFTSGANPALHSLGAVCLHACGYSSEVGTLFGAKAVLVAVAHIISPTIFATTYAKTVAHFPQAIFILATALIYTSVILLAGVRPPIKEIEEAYATNTQDQPLLDNELEGDEIEEERP
ncbi:hypothetical protein M378DRAFT_1022862 [Amanita muscaria Koide BX008]|uniref:MFS general substrate transporter n=1 Tax=Amanita muscaria (strain Koide BX008) TaxID=946122 RepID=A0A0C2TKS1_AMAMK|nr:hypothetical protein M378DRAFT_1022862 [Amanita muscaria Koide BX008]